MSRNFPRTEENSQGCGPTSCSNIFCETSDVRLERIGRLDYACNTIPNFDTRALSIAADGYDISCKIRTNNSSWNDKTANHLGVDRV
jgi:hypothetical protein